MQGQHAARLQGAAAAGIKLGGVELHCRAERIGQIQHDLVEAFLALLDKGTAIAQTDLQTRIVKSTTMDLRQPRACHVDHLAVQLGQHHALHFRVLQQLLDRTAIATADHQGRTRATQ